MKPLQYAFFLGCLIPARFPQLEYLARRVFPKLGIELVDVPGFSCCPDPAKFRGADRLTWLALAARNLSIAARSDLPLLTLCPACAATLATAKNELHKNPALLDKIAPVLDECGIETALPSEVKHFIKALYEDLGLEKLKAAVSTPLSGLALASHSGCHENNPVEIMQFDNPFNPVKTEDILSVLGARVIDYQEKSLCCGSTLMTDGAVDNSLKPVVRKVEDMHASGADAMAVGCASCFQQYDTGQMLASRKGISQVTLPVFHLVELLALALDVDFPALGRSHHKISLTGLIPESGRADGGKHVS